jgi:SAM-dependent methyltransferase
LSSLSNPVRARIRRRRAKDSVSKLAFRVSYLRRSREIYRRYLESKPWLNQLYTIFLDIKPGQKIVEVGCGTGDFARHLARLSRKRARVLGIDSNEKSIQAAIADTKEARLSRSVAYKLGDVNMIPLEDSYADLTCCRTLLMHLTSPLKAVMEMSRVTKTNGSVVAIERGKMSAFFTIQKMKNTVCWVSEPMKHGSAESGNWKEKNSRSARNFQGSSGRQDYPVSRQRSKPTRGCTPIQDEDWAT